MTDHKHRGEPLSSNPRPLSSKSNEPVAWMYTANYPRIEFSLQPVESIAWEPLYRGLRPA